MKNWTLKHIEALQKAGKVKAELPKKSEPTIGGKIVAKHFKCKSAGKDFIGFALMHWCQDRKLQLHSEYKFHFTRKWRFDWAIPQKAIAIEYEGGVWDRSKTGSHTSVKDIKRDTEKYNAAAGLGWKVFRFNAMNYKTVISELENILDKV